MKGYKITNCAQDKRIGIVGRSLNEVFTKGCQKLKVKKKIILNLNNIRSARLLSRCTFLTTFKQLQLC